MGKQILVLDKGTKTADILNKIRYEATPEYRRNIPEATQADLKASAKALHNYAPGWNEFVNAIINKVGLTIQKSNNWTNPLGIFKRGMLDFGESIEEINVGLTQAYVYEEHAFYGEQMLFGRETPEVQADYHKVNRKNIYKITVDHTSLRRAILTETGLAEFINQLMEVPTTSDNRDEYLLMRQLFAEYEENGGFYKESIPVIPTDGDASIQARQALRKIKAMRNKLKFLSRKYNAAGMEVSTQNKELHLFATPDFMAALDIEALAVLFNVSYGEIEEHVTIIDDFEMEDKDIQAILTTSDFFVVADTVYEMRSQPNAAGLHENFFLHRQQIISASRFVPAVAFTYGAGTEDVVEEVEINPVTAITVSDVPGGTALTKLKRGELFYASAVFDIDPEDAYNYGVVWTLTGSANGRSTIDQSGHVNVNIEDAAASLKISAYTAGLDPESAFTVTLPVVGTRYVAWPEPHLVFDENEDGVEDTPDPEDDPTP